jgi:hypothetical protein
MKVSVYILSLKKWETKSTLSPTRKNRSKTQNECILRKKIAIKEGIKKGVASQLLKKPRLNNKL